MAIFILAFAIVILLDNFSPLLKNQECGSYVDLGARSFVYWDGPQPAERQSIELDRITEIRISEFLVEDGFIATAALIDVHDDETDLLTHCLNQPYDTWAKVVSEKFPEIRVVFRN